MDELSTKDHPDWWRPVGGQNSKDSTLERRSLVWNDNNIVDGVDPPAFYTDKFYVGKFFTRGMRGMIEEIQIYCRDAGVERITLWISPHPCLGPFYTLDITTLDTWAWRGAVLERMWNYDSLFIWIYGVWPGVDWAYDDVEPYDGHEGDYPFHTWDALDIRPYIRVIYSGETPGDVPISGIVNTIPIPSASSMSWGRDHPVAVDDETEIVGFLCAGYVDYIEALVDAAVNSHITYIRVYCDEVLAMDQQFAELNSRGHTTATPTVSLPKYGEDLECVMLIHKRFEFRRIFTVYAYNLLNLQTVTVDVYPTYME